jgi:hypothetical protein
MLFFISGQRRPRFVVVIIVMFPAASGDRPEARRRAR